MKRALCVFLLWLAASYQLLAAELGRASDADPRATYGELSIAHIDSQIIGQRRVLVWQPSGFSHERPYSILFMHDGQMLFDDSVTWNGQAWDVDEVITELQSVNAIGQVVVVGIDNADQQRRQEYFPQAAYAHLSDVDREQAPFHANDLLADNYVRFLVDELRPWLSRRFGLDAVAERSYLMGSSMGGLISMYALTRYPDQFAGAACLSTHWPGNVPVEGTDTLAEAVQTYLASSLIKPGRHRWYFDHGTETLDQYYAPWQARVDRLFAERGYIYGQDFVSRVFVGADHSEHAWNKRLHLPMLFLFGHSVQR